MITLKISADEAQLSVKDLNMNEAYINRMTTMDKMVDTVNQCTEVPENKTCQNIFAFAESFFFHYQNECYI